MEQKRLYFAVFLIQSIYAGSYLVSKVAFNDGMNSFIFIFYRQAVATVFLTPFALFFEWKKAPQLSIRSFCMILLLSLCGMTLTLELYGVALIYTSATLAAACANSLPVITFFLAVVLIRMEMLRLNIAGISKLVGVVICIGGVLTLALFKGPHFNLVCFHHLFGPNETHHTQGPASSSHTWIKGCFIMLTSYTCWAIWLVLQGKVAKGYPSKLMLTTLQCFMSSIQSLLVAIAVERNPAEWKLSWNLRLLAVVYSGVVATGVSFCLQSWVIEKKGPVFLALSTPLNLILTLICSALLLCEAITLGSIMGGVLLVGGLYSVLWGKIREQKMVKKHSVPIDVENSASNIKIVPTE